MEPLKRISSVCSSNPWRSWKIAATSCAIVMVLGAVRPVHIASPSAVSSPSAPRLLNVLVCESALDCSYGYRVEASLLISRVAVWVSLAMRLAFVGGAEHYCASSQKSRELQIGGDCVGCACLLVLQDEA